MSPQLNGSNISRGLRSLPDLTEHLTTRADDNHAPPVWMVASSTSLYLRIRCQGLVRFFALLRIKPHTPQHLTTRADDNHAPPVWMVASSTSLYLRIRFQGLVRFFALLRIKPHTPPLVRDPVNSFEYHTCVHTPKSEESFR